MGIHKTLFSIKNGCFSYGTRTVFSNLNFTLQKGTFYGLIGPNGSGKSTLIDLLCGFKRLATGEIFFQSTPLGSFQRKQLALEMALVPQTISLGFDYSVYDIVMMGRHPHIPRFNPPSVYDRECVEAALTTLDISHLKNRSVLQLSGGERQRVVVARALAQDTPILLLDEATSNLDIEHTLQIMQVLKQKVVTQRCTVIAAIHDLNMAAAFCDQLLVLHKGRLHSSGEVKTILTPQLLKEVFSVNSKIIMDGSYPHILFDMLHTL